MIRSKPKTDKATVAQVARIKAYLVSKGIEKPTFTNYRQKGISLKWWGIGYNGRAKRRAAYLKKILEGAPFAYQITCSTNYYRSGVVLLSIPY